MLVLKKIAVTGGFASGKSTVCHMFEELGAYVVSADAIVHQLLSPDNLIGQQVVNLLGSDILSEGQFDRKKIAERVFSHPEKLRALERIIHPAVFEEIEKRYQQIKNQGGYPLFVAEIPLLYESERSYRGGAPFDLVLSVVADPSLCRARFASQGKWKDEEFERRMERQLDPHAKAAQADVTIENNGNLSELKNQVIKIYSSLT